MAHSRFSLGVALGALVLGTILGLEAVPVRAGVQTGDGITVDYKETLLDAATDLLDLSWDLLHDLRTEVFDPLKDVKDWKVEAQAALESCLRYDLGGYQACVAKAMGLIQSADQRKLQSAYPGIQVVHGTLSELEEEVTSLVLEIEQAILDGDIGQTTAESLAKRTICINTKTGKPLEEPYKHGPCPQTVDGVPVEERPYAPLLVILVFLADKDMFLVEMDKLLEQANEYESEALAWLNTIATCGTNTDCQKRAVKEALAALKKSVRVIRETMKYLWKIKDNIRFIVAWLCGFRQLVVRAPILDPGEGSSSPGPSCPWCLAFPGLEVRASVASGVIRFVALGPEVEALQVRVFDLAGRAVYDSGLVAGNMLTWQTRGVANGVYLYVIMVRGPDGAIISSEVKKLAIVR
jgi:hypothetical protein